MVKLGCIVNTIHMTELLLFCHSDNVARYHGGYFLKRFRKLLARELIVY